MSDAEPAGAINDFGSIADIYDQLVDWAPYALWVKDLEKRLRRWGLAKGDWILDAACGTGLSVWPWLRRGYRVVGTDVSERMLERARREAREAGFEVEFLRQDILGLDLGRRFGLAVCMHSGLDYILDPDDLRRAFRSLRGGLRRGGLLAFDKCLDEPGFYRTAYSDTRTLSCGRAHFLYRWDRGGKMLEQRCTVFRTDGNSPRRAEFVFHLKATPLAELIAMVEGAGFETLAPPEQFSTADPGMGIFRAI